MIWRTLCLAGCLALPGSTRADDGLTGVASWYGTREQDRFMANGQPFQALGLTAASRTLPLGQCIRVTVLASGRIVVLPVTDRGPAIRSRVLDLSLGAALRLHMVEAGLAHVRIEPLHSCASGATHAP